MYCTNCGQRLADDAKHCPNCGAPIVRDEARGENTYTNEQQAQEQPGYSYGAGQQARPEDGRTDYSYGQAPHERDPYAYSYAAPPAPTKEDSNALTGLILAIISAVCCCVPFIGLPCSIIAIVFAVKGLKSTTRHTMAIVALILAIIFTLCNAATIVSLVIMLVKGDSWKEIFDEIYKNMGSFDFYDRMR